MQSQTEKQEEGRDHKQVKDYWIIEKSMYSAHYSEDSVQLSILIIFSPTCLCYRLSPGGGRGRGRGRGRSGRGPNPRRPAVPQQSPAGRKVRSELKTRDQILKQRKKVQKQKFLQGGGMKKLRAKNRQWLSEIKKSGFGRGSQKKGKMKKRLWGGCRSRVRVVMAVVFSDHGCWAERNLASSDASPTSNVFMIRYPGWHICQIISC